MALAGQDDFGLPDGLLAAAKPATATMPARRNEEPIMSGVVNESSEIGSDAPPRKFLGRLEMVRSLFQRI